ncbi:MAG TPA: alpha-amylase family protein, partial [Euzebyales bacterium]|nr:alpha-amylase family protein [Euzebyales bacterium]
MSLERTADLWWKHAVIYCLDVETFYDSDGDGIGDFAGLTQCVDYFAGVGVTCIWLMPFYPSPNRDDGYDLSDHYAIDHRLGTFGDFTEFMRTARDRGIRVIADLVVNHTSSDHPWFRSAREDPGSRYRDYYVWRDEIPEEGPHEVVFPGEQEGAWTWDATAGQYYHHRFLEHQPDLNVANTEVRDEIRKVIGFWLAQGLSGFRVDAVPFFLETEGIAEEMEIAPHDYLRDLCEFLTRRTGEAIMLGEVNVAPDQLGRFFGDEDGDELQMLFNFPAMQALYVSLARGVAQPFIDALRSLPAAPAASQWASFVRNHDELTLDKLTDDERQEVFEAFGPEEDMQIYGRGLRRRLPPMLAGEEDRIRLVYSLMFAMPGTPTIFYGEEIGMGENLAVEGRRSVRTPMQWTDEPSAGFSTADPGDLRRPLPGGEYGPEHVNVRAQRRDPGSLLNWFERMIRLRRETPEVGWGDWTILDIGARGLVAIRYDWQGATLVTVHN